MNRSTEAPTLCHSPQLLDSWLIVQPLQVHLASYADQKRIVAVRGVGRRLQAVSPTQGDEGNFMRHFGGARE